MASKTNADPDEATFTFEGTVKKVKAATMRAVPVDDRTAVVRVEQVIEAPKNLKRTTGQDITVQLAGRGKVSSGQRFVFHAAGWIFGESIAVRALAQEPVGPRQRALLDRGGDPGAHHFSRELQKRVDGSNLVVSGQVVSVQMPAGSATAARDAAPEEIARRPVSEHDPKWREALVLVDDVHKGEHEAQQLSVLFPSSHDVRWFRAPKFEAGQKGYFVLRKAKMKPSEKAGVAARALTLAAGAPVDDSETEVFTALHPLDFQPLAQPLIRQAIGAKEE